MVTICADCIHRIKKWKLWALGSDSGWMTVFECGASKNEHWHSDLVRGRVKRIVSYTPCETKNKGECSDFKRVNGFAYWKRLFSGL